MLSPPESLENTASTFPINFAVDNRNPCRLTFPADSQLHFCMQNNVERKHAIHENRLASVKASLSLSTPLRLDFMDKRLSKNYHASRWRARVVNQNLKLLRALEEIHSRGGGRLGDGSRSAGIVPSAKGDFHLDHPTRSLLPMTTICVQELLVGRLLRCVDCELRRQKGVAVLYREKQCFL